MGKATTTRTMHELQPSKFADKDRPFCISCGKTRLPKRKRRYCGDKCKQRLDFALYIATGLVLALRARYAAFSYTEETLILDILPTGAASISRFAWKRSKGNNVADELLEMIEQAGRDWYAKQKETGSKWWASELLLNRTSQKDIPIKTIVPVSRITPQLNHKEKAALKLLELTREQILSKEVKRRIKSAYRKKAKIHHPDKGDTSNKFVQINEAHSELLNWAKNPKFHSRAALPNSWCYDSSKNRWAPPA